MARGRHEEWTINTAELPFIDLFDGAYTVDPDPFLARFRDNGGVARSARGIEVLTYDAVTEILRSEGFEQGRARVFQSMGITEGPVYDTMTRLIINLEGDVHRRQRRSVYRWFTAKKAEEWRGQVAQWINDWLDRGIEGNQVDLFNVIARPLPSTLFCKIIGAPIADAEKVAGWSEGILSIVNPSPESVQRLVAAQAEGAKYLYDLIEHKRKEPGDDLLSALIEAEAEGDIDAKDMIDISFSILTGSTDTTSTQICLNLDTLARHPEQRAQLQEDPSLLHSAVLELMRFRPGMLSTPRAPKGPGQTLSVLDEIDPDAFYHANIEAANKDPLVYSNPTTLDITREFRGKMPLNFGSGRHGCLGQVLSLLEQEEVLRACLSRWSDFRVLEFGYEGAPTMHFARSMRIEFDPA